MTYNMYDIITDWGEYLISVLNAIKAKHFTLLNKDDDDGSRKL